MHHTRSIWLAIILLFAVITGAAGGVLSWLGGLKPAHAVLAAAGTFTGAVLLGLAIGHFLTGTDQ